MELDPNASSPPPPPPRQEKKKSGFWSAVKWLGGGVVLGIAGYEGLKFWRKVRGEDTPAEDPRTANPTAPMMGASPMLGMLPPQVMPVPMPMPYPMPSLTTPAPAPAPAPAAPADADLTAKERRERNRQRRLEQRIEQIEALMEEDF